jgi:hypothetical protein
VDDCHWATSQNSKKNTLVLYSCIDRYIIRTKNIPLLMKIAHEYVLLKCTLELTVMGMSFVTGGRAATISGWSLTTNG